MSTFAKTFHAGWGDMDFNGHMRNTAYLDKSGDVRMFFFREHGFVMAEFSRLGVGPVITSDKLDYFRELRLLEEMTVTLVATGMSEDGSRFRLVNTFTRADGKKSAIVTSNGGWLNLVERKLMVPPPALFDAMKKVPRGDGFETLPNLSV